MTDNFDTEEAQAIITWVSPSISNGSFAYATQGIQFDVVEAEFISRTATLTSNPRSGKSPVFDHYQPQPVAISLEVFVSNTPITIPTTQVDEGVTGLKTNIDLPLNEYPKTRSLPSARLITNAAAKNQNQLPLPPRQRNQVYESQGASVLVFSSDLNRVANVFNVVEDLMLNRTAVTLSLTAIGKDFDNMYLTSYQAPRDANTGDALILRLDFQEISVADADLTIEKHNPAPKKPQHKRKKPRGPKATSDVQAGGVEDELARQSIPLDPSYGNVSGGQCYMDWTLNAFVCP